MKTSFTVAAGQIGRLYHSLVDWGVSEERILATSGIKPNELVNPDVRIPVEKYIYLGRAAFEMTDVAEIGLVLGEQAAFENIGVVFQLAINCKNMRESLRFTAKYSNLINEVYQTNLIETEETVEWSTTYINSQYICPTLLEFDCCQGMKIFRSVIGHDFEALQIKFQHSPPSYADKYRAFFDAPILFDQERSGIVFKTEYLDVPNPNPQKYVKSILKKLADDLDKEIVETNQFHGLVKSLIVHHLESGSLTLDLIASELGMSKRTVCRKLQVEDVSYKGLLNEVQKQFAQLYLAEGTKTIGEISLLLGFSEASAFHRAFKRWFGINPSRFRQKHKSDKHAPGV